MHVLIVDTSAAELRSISDLLSSHKVSVSAAKSIPVAVNYLEDHEPDLLIIKKSDRYGSFIKDFALDERFSDIPLLLLPDKGASSVVKKFLLNEKSLSPAKEEKASSAEGSDNSAPSDADATDAPLITDSFPEIPGISWEEAVKNCGGASIVPQVVQKFYDSIDNRIETIETSFRAKDWKNYTIYVHSLKSSARLIGAISLSQEARQLEAFGNCQSEDDINDKTGPVLEKLRFYKDILKPVVKTSAQKELEDASKPLISEKDLNSALKDLKECLSITDFDSADFIVQELEKWQIPEDKKEMVTKIKQAVSDVHKTQALELLGGV